MQKKLVSFIIVNYNSSALLKECIDSIFNQTYKNIEVVVVDNNSSDGSVKMLNKFYKDKITLVVEKSNHGFSGGNNIGYKYCSGDYVILLNNDTKIEKNYVLNFIKVFEDYPKCGIAQSKIVLYDNPSVLNIAGSFWSPTTFLYHEGYFKDATEEIFNQSKKIFAAMGASMIIKREVIEKIGFFDVDFWHYYEDTDLCHRAVNAGYEIIYYPKALCFHKVSHSRTVLNQEMRIYFHNSKNKFISFIKNFVFPDVLFVLLRHLFFLNLYVFFMILKGRFREVVPIYTSVFWVIRNSKKILRKRKLNRFKGTEKSLQSKRIPLFKYLITGSY